MTVQLLFRWWYGPGFRWVFQGLLLDKLHYVSEVFSVKDMVTTLFAPFRQTYVGKQQGVGALQAFADRTVSRAIGFVVRSLLLIVAAVAATLVLLVGLILVAAWPFIPLLPLVAIILGALGVGA
ncbi:hypothetical protein KC957_01805 [Candidatus Saccharibacteria bacterium]|nr:hypothetical protein [Candidatus Saccharibacteria bacterium]